MEEKQGRISQTLLHNDNSDVTLIIIGIAL